MEREFVELASLLKAVKANLEGSFPRNFWVKAEIAQISPSPRGYCYLTLVQTDKGVKTAECRAVIWSNNYLMIKGSFEAESGSQLKAGLTVLLKVSINFSEKFGLSLYVEDIDPVFTAGELALRRQRTFAALAEGGYDNMQKELVLPRLPRTIAIISSSKAAGLQDFFRHIAESEYKFDMDVYEALVQGEAAASSIIDAFEQVRNSGKIYDAVLLLRGGGSDMDLLCFDDYTLACHIATYPFPVLTAIGHDKDFHAADFVANKSVKTPTALADFLLDCYLSEDAKIDALQRSISQRAQNRIRTAMQHLELLNTRITLSDPRSILKKGFVLVTGPDGRVLKNIAPLTIGDQISLMFSDGTATATIDNLKD